MRIKANGIEMNYELSGKSGAPVVMMSHSLGSSLTMWEPQLRSLEPLFQILRYDTRGHGGTEAPVGPYTIENSLDTTLSVSWMPCGYPGFTGSVYPWEG